MGHFKQNIVFNEPIYLFLPFISHWKRYINYIFFLWSGSEQYLLEFLSFINTNNRNLKFTILVHNDYNAERMHLLDIFYIGVAMGLALITVQIKILCFTGSLFIPQLYQFLGLIISGASVALILILPYNLKPWNYVSGLDILNWIG